MKATYIKKNNVVVRFSQAGEKREATILTNHGCTCNEETKKFNTSEEGNNFFKECMKDGFTKATVEDFDKVVIGF